MNGSGGVWSWDDDGGHSAEELLAIAFSGLNGKIQWQLVDDETHDELTPLFPHGSLSKSTNLSDGFLPNVIAC